jgi:hypothetical protein
MVSSTMLVRRAQFTHLAPVEGRNYGSWVYACGICARSASLEVPRIEVLGGEIKKKEAVRRLEE